MEGFYVEDRRIVDDKMTVETLRNCRGGQIEQLYVGEENVEEAMKLVQKESEEREKLKIQKRKEKQATRKNEIHYSYDIIEAGDWDGTYVISSAEYRDGAPVYLCGEEKELWRVFLEDGKGWVLGYYPEIHFGVRTDQLSVPGDNWGSFKGEQLKPYVNDWVTFEEKANDLKTTANLRFKQKNFHQASLLYSQALEYSPDNPTILANRAECHMRLENYAKAVEDATSAASSAGGDNKVLLEKCFVRLGRALQALERYREAADAFSKAISLSPDNTEHKDRLRAARTLASESPELKEARRALTTHDDVDTFGVVSPTMKRILQAEPDLLRVALERKSPAQALALARAAPSTKTLKHKINSLARDVLLHSDDARAISHAVHFSTTTTQERLCELALGTPKSLGLRPETCQFTKTQWTTTVQHVAAKAITALPCKLLLSLLSSKDPELAKIALRIRATDVDDVECLELAKEIASAPGERARFGVKGFGDDLVYYHDQNEDETKKLAKCLELMEKAVDVMFTLSLLHAQPKIAAHALRLLADASESQARTLVQLNVQRPLLGMAAPTPKAPVSTCLASLFKTDKNSVRSAARILKYCAKYPGAFDSAPFDDARAIRTLEAMAKQDDCVVRDVVSVLTSMCAAREERLALIDHRFFENVLVPRFYRRENDDDASRDLLKMLLIDTTSSKRLAAKLQQTRGNSDLMLRLASAVFVENDAQPTVRGATDAREDEVFASVDAKESSMSNARRDYAKIVDLVGGTTCRCLEIGRLAGLCPHSTVYEPRSANARTALLSSFTVKTELKEDEEFDIVLFLEADEYIDPPDWQEYLASFRHAKKKDGFVLILCRDQEQAYLVADDAAQAGFVEDELSATLYLPNRRQLLVFKHESSTAAFETVVGNRVRKTKTSSPTQVSILAAQLGDLD